MRVCEGVRVCACVYGVRAYVCACIRIRESKAHGKSLIAPATYGIL